MYDTATDTFSVRILPTGNASMAGIIDMNYMRRDSHMRAVMQHENTTRRIYGGMAEALADQDAANAYWQHVHYGHTPDVSARYSDVV